VEGAYHGNLTSLIEISPYKFDGPGGRGAPAHVRKASLRVQDFHEVVRGPAAFIVESILSCAGQIVLPNGFLAEAFRQVRKAGGVCISDEIQTGFGRVGSHFWAFETQGVVPDIVTMGKPIGNGHPLGAVVTTPEIAACFNNGMEYFNTFGGNPVSCAAGLAVLDVIQEESLQQKALEVGLHLKERLSDLKSVHPEIKDVRGLGLFLGIELTRAVDASYIIERMKSRGILLSVDGPLHNVIKIKPPLVFTKRDADALTETLNDVMGETFIKRRL
jgi:4-aminobutyrate aminotransferase-like enzyme